MAAYDIKQHFKELRVDTGRKKGRDPFATGFEDDSDEEKRSRRRDRSKAKPPPVSEKPKAASIAGISGLAKASVLDQLRDSDDEWLGAPHRTERQPSPAPAQLPSLRVTDGAGRRGSVDKGLLVGGKPARSAIVQAAGQLAYLDDSDDEELLTSPKRVDRRPSPAPRHDSDPGEPGERSSTPRGTRASPKEDAPSQPSKHTVASAFAGTKYLQDSDSDEEAVSSRKNSAESGPPEDDDLLDPLSPYESALKKPKAPEVKRVDKQKQSNGSGVSWRAFSASRTEQRSAEIEALQVRLRQRGKSISFGTHALTDDGKRVPVAAAAELQRKGSAATRGRPGGRGKSPPRRTEDTKPAEDELTGEGAGGPVFDPREYKTNPFTGQPVKRTFNDSDPDAIANKGLETSSASLPDIRIDDISNP